MHALGLRSVGGPAWTGPLFRRLATAVAAALLVTGAASALAADAADQLDRERVRSGVWAGPTVINGLMQLRSDVAQADTAIDYLPAVALGVDYWPDPAIGTYLGAEIGTGARIALPADRGGVSLDYNLYRFEAGARYRWYFGPRSGAPSLFVVGGLRGRWQTAQAQSLSVLVDRIIAGPEAGLGFAWPVVSDRVWFRISGRAGMPFFVREPGDDSGQVDGVFAYGGRLDVAVRVLGGWYVQLVGDLQDESLDFAGDGTRAAGVTGVRTHDRFITGGLLVRYAL